VGFLRALHTKGADALPASPFSHSYVQIPSRLQSYHSSQCISSVCCPNLTHLLFGFIILYDTVQKYIHPPASQSLHNVTMTITSCPCTVYDVRDLSLCRRVRRFKCLCDLGETLELVRTQRMLRRQLECFSISTGKVLGTSQLVPALVRLRQFHGQYNLILPKEVCLQAVSGISPHLMGN